MVEEIRGMYPASFEEYYKRVIDSATNASLQSKQFCPPIDF